MAMTKNASYGPVSGTDVLELIRCPVSGQRLRWSGPHLLSAEEAAHQYKFEDGIYHLMHPLPSSEVQGQSSLRAEKEETRCYYDGFGWQTSDGMYGEVKAFTDVRSAPWSYTSRCIRRVGKFIARKGRYLLDVASGPIPYPEYIELQQGFKYRVCVDLSVEALKEAQRKLGYRGIYILADMTRLPLATGSIDAAVSFHTVYHIPADEQANAFLELHRVLRNGAVGAVVYSWGYSPITARLNRLLDRRGAPAAAGTSESGLYYHAHEKEWFLGRPWPFSYEVRAWRTMGSSILQRLGNGPLNRIAYRLLYVLESIFSSFLGRHGQYPLILIRKAAG
jgi:SAM-dependent methyltransferase